MRVPSTRHVDAKWRQVCNNETSTKLSRQNGCNTSYDKMIYEKTALNLHFNINNGQINKALLVVVVAVVSMFNVTVNASPPIDYFIYTSQLATAQPGSQNISSLLPSIDSIYSNTNHRKLNDEQQANSSMFVARVLSLVQNSSHTHDNNRVDLETTQLAWNLMERQAILYMRNRVHALRPFVQELLAEAHVSSACATSVSSWLDELTQLKHWATLMWNSWGQFPAAGMFQGTYTDLGSYDGCISIVDNQLIGQAQYCMLDFQPIVPTRPRFHSIFKRILGHEAGQLTNGDYSPFVDSVNAQTVSHGIASDRYKRLFDSSTLNNGGVTQQQAANSKYSKRTIEHNGTLLDNANVDNSAIIAPTTSTNLSLNAEALIELARKAQYFYYVKFRLGACLPSKCSLDDVKQLAQVASQRAILQSSQVNCMKREPFAVNTYQVVAISILSVLAFVAILGAIVDLLGYKENLHQKSALINWLLPFSIVTNAKRLFDSDAAAGTHADLECVHGLRFFSMIWVIYGHTILYTEYQSFTHFYDVVETQIPSFILLPSLNANFSVDTFFVISGILTTYVTWEFTKGDARKFNKFAFLISRYIRLTPQLAIVILCFFLLPLFGDGPMFRQVTDDQAQTCYNNWAINLLYLQSYIRADKLCIDPSWWLSIEMTFHVVSIFVIVVMIQNVRHGMILNALVALVLTTWGALIHYSNGMAIQYLPSIPQRYEVRSEQTKLFFHRPYPHAASYFIGIALGYVLANKTIKKLNKSQVFQGWFVCTLGLCISLWGSFYWNLGAPYTQVQATLYYNLCQVLWPTSIAWIILACSLGHGGFVNSILSARCFVPLGRITYMTYLSHALIIYYHSARMNITVEPSMLLFTYLFIANTTLALLLGVVLTVVYESPILNLQKQLFSYLTQKFDPTLRANAKTNSHCLPTRLPLADTNQTANGHHSLVSCNNSNGHQFANGFNSSAAAQVLLLDQNYDKFNQHEQKHVKNNEDDDDNDNDETIVLP